MENIEKLKQELIAQKNMLESKGITVTTAHINPSPAELTTAISHISPKDMSKATATASDVASGKTFYNSAGELEVGNMSNAYQEIWQNYLNRSMPETFDENFEYKPFIFSDIDTPTKKHIIQEGVTTLPEYTFYSSKIEQIVWPDSLTDVGEHCFDECNNLKSLTIPNTVTTLPSSMCYSCDSLEEINFGTGISIIPERCFYNVPNLKQLIVPANITEIATLNFTTSATVEKAVFLAENTKLNSMLFNGKHIDTLQIWLPFKSLYRYLAQSSFWYFFDHLVCEVEITTETEFPIPETETTRSVSIIWATTPEDILARANLLATPTGAGTYYAGIIKN